MSKETCQCNCKDCKRKEKPVEKKKSLPEYFYDNPFHKEEDFK